jgi:hypothetical protein
MFYVYEHINPKTGACFYVGKTSNPRRMHYFIRKSEKYNKIIETLRFNGLVPVVNVLHETLFESEALKLEKDRIIFYGIENLCNIRMNCGGRLKHGLGRKMREEIRKAISKTKKNQPSSKKGIKMPEETKQKIRETKRISRSKNIWTEALEFQRIKVEEI